MMLGPRVGADQKNQRQTQGETARENILHKQTLVKKWPRANANFSHAAKIIPANKKGRQISLAAW
jgi:hypothetical protein